MTLPSLPHELTTPGTGPGGEPQAVVVPVTEEELRIGHRTADTGGVRVRKLVARETLELEVPRVIEEVDTRRVAVDRVIDQPMGVRQEGDVLIVPVIEERLVVSKQLVLVEEIHITRTRRTEQRREQIHLDREVAVVERQDAGDRLWRPDEPARDGGQDSGPGPPHPR